LLLVPLALASSFTFRFEDCGSMVNGSKVKAHGSRQRGYGLWLQGSGFNVNVWELRVEDWQLGSELSGLKLKI
jgi:hypothetical protein